MFPQSVPLWLGATLLLSHCQSIVCDNFQDPASNYRAKFRYWLPDASISSDIVAKDIRDIKAAGAGGLELLPYYLYGMGDAVRAVSELPDWTKYGFGTPAFVSLFKDALAAAKDVDAVMDYAMGANQGQGIPSEVGTHGLSVQLLLGSTTVPANVGFNASVPEPLNLSSYITSGLNFQHPLEQFQTPNLTAVIAYEVLSQSPVSNITGYSTVLLNQASYIDLSSLVKDDMTLQWTPPNNSKTWKIMSVWESYTNQRSCDGGPNASDFLGNGSWTVDHFSKAGAARVTDFWDQYILSDDEVSSLLSSVGNYGWEDSMEQIASLFWTPGLLDRFQAKHGYSLLPYVPLLFSASNTWGSYVPPYTEAFGFGNDTDIGNSIYQLDYRSVLNDGYQDYISHFQNWTHSVGTKYSNQPAYNLPLQMLSDIPLLDAPEGESLGFNQNIDAYRQFSGPAQLNNISVISSELGAVNVAAYTQYVPNLLQQIKRSLSGGITMHVLHGYPSSSPYPNTTWPAYTAFFFMYTEMWNPVQPAWQHMQDALNYVGRNQWIMQQGSPKVDLAMYLYESPWTPKTVYNSTNLQDLGFTYSYLGPDNLASSSAIVNDKQLGVPGYKALLCDQQTVVTIEAAENLVKMSSQGLPIIFIGTPPSQAYPTQASNQTALTKTMQQLLTSNNVHQVTSEEDVPALLSQLSITPRSALSCSSNPVFVGRRTSSGVDYIYFFNDQDAATSCIATLETSPSVTPYIYNSWTGDESPLLEFTRGNGSLSFPFSLQGNETLILALQSGARNASACTFSKTSENVHSLSLGAEHKVHALLTGSSTLTASSGQSISLDASVPSPTSLKTWNLIIEDWHSTPDRFAMQTEITNHTFSNTTLKPWTQISSSLVNVSGVGHYTTQFTVSPVSNTSDTLVPILSLPKIQHTARVYVDGEWLGPIDPVKPVVELRNVSAGQHELRVDVTTPLFNRVKSEANETLMVGQPAGVLQPLYASTPPQEYGLVGDVTLTWAVEKVVDC